MSTMVEPQLWIGGEANAGSIALEDERAWHAWFDSYRRFIVHHAVVARRPAPRCSASTPSSSRPTRMPRTGTPSSRRCGWPPARRFALRREQRGQRPRRAVLGCARRRRRRLLEAAGRTEKATDAALEEGARQALRLWRNCRSKWSKPVILVEAGYPSVRAAWMAPRDTFSPRPPGGEDAAAINALLRALAREGPGRASTGGGPRPTESPRPPASARSTGSAGGEAIRENFGSTAGRRRAAGEGAPLSAVWRPASPPRSGGESCSPTGCNLPHGSVEGENDFVTHADREGRRAIIARHPGSFPDDAFLAEEGGAAPARRARGSGSSTPSTGPRTSSRASRSGACRSPRCGGRGARRRQSSGTPCDERSTAERGVRQRGAAAPGARGHRAAPASRAPSSPRDFPFRNRHKIDTYLAALQRRCSGTRAPSAARARRRLDLAYVAAGVFDRLLRGPPRALGRRRARAPDPGGRRAQIRLRRRGAATSSGATSSRDRPASPPESRAAARGIVAGAGDPEWSLSRSGDSADAPGYSRSNAASRLSSRRVEPGTVRARARRPAARARTCASPAGWCGSQSSTPSAGSKSGPPRASRARRSAFARRRAVRSAASGKSACAMTKSGWMVRKALGKIE